MILSRLKRIDLHLSWIEPISEVNLSIDKKYNWIWLIEFHKIWFCVFFATTKICENWAKFPKLIIYVQKIHSIWWLIDFDKMWFCVFFCLVSKCKLSQSGGRSVFSMNCTTLKIYIFWNLIVCGLLLIVRLKR